MSSLGDLPGVIQEPALLIVPAEGSRTPALLALDGKRVVITESSLSPGGKVR
jgi:hypothetical protein